MAKVFALPQGPLGETKYYGWHEFLNLISHEMRENLWPQAVKAANDWRNCPMLNATPLVPRDLLGLPADPKLREAGTLFGKAIQQQNAPMARTYLKVIEERIAHIVSSLGHVTLVPGQPISTS